MKIKNFSSEQWGQSIDVPIQASYGISLPTEAGMGIHTQVKYLIGTSLVLENKIKLNEETGDYKDFRFAKWMTKNIGVQGIPPSAFYSDSNKKLGENYIRICFIKVSYFTHWLISTFLRNSHALTQVRVPTHLFYFIVRNKFQVTSNRIHERQTTNRTLT